MQTTVVRPSVRVFLLLLTTAALVAVAPASAQDAPLGGLPSIMLTQLPASVAAPVHVANAGDGSGRLFIVEQGGDIRVFKNNQLLATPFLDVSTLIRSGGEEGLLSVAFHPSYESNGYFYVYYTDLAGDITLARYQVSADPDVADPASGQIVLVVPHPVNSNHNGGQLAFGPFDGYLYMGTGDGGGGGDPLNNAQNKSVLLGKMLRLDVDATGTIPCGQTNPMPYGIPADNPFVGSMTDCHEIWAYGLRNPWRFAFDRVTTDLFIADVGQNLWEEIDFQAASSAGGENYGWRLMEGTHCYDPPTNCNDGTLTLPILEYDHGLGCSVTGGFRYRGAAIPALVGYYLYSDICTGFIRGGTDVGGGVWSSQLLLDTSLAVSSFGEDEGGELYVVDLGGAVYRIDQAPNPTPAITSLSPNAAIAGDPGFTLTVNGSGFVIDSVVRWNGSDRPTTFVSPLQLTADIPAGDIAAVGTASITVFNPAPGGGLSGPATFNINATFLDVPVSHFAEPFIQTIFDLGITAGCGPRLFCPDDETTRAQMAVFLLKALLGAGYAPPAATGIFDDVPLDGYAPFIEDLYTRGITVGCGGGPPPAPFFYCPEASVTRGQMAVFLVKTFSLP